MGSVVVVEPARRQRILETLDLEHRPGAVSEALLVVHGEGDPAAERRRWN